jgi:ubiquinone/menaquinone biosynthesis C-methylase UbiE
MRSQRLPDAAPCLAGCAESLPFDDQSFDAAMAVCTVHHWQDRLPACAGCATRRVVNAMVASVPWKRSVEAFLQPLRVLGELMHLDDVRE